MISTLSNVHRLERLQSLRDKKLVTARTVGNKTIYKYSRRVFWENLWNEDPILLEARGLVLDEYGNILVRPFTKIFNHMENGSTFPRDELVHYVEKKNGYMGVVSVIFEDGKYKSLVSTSGSLDSDFVALTKKYLGEAFLDMLACKGYQDTTFLFEICATEDPHIIEEEHHVYLIGARRTTDEYVYSEPMLDSLAHDWNALKIENLHIARPTFYIGRFSDVVKIAKAAKHEGFMVYSLDYLNNRKALKIKSPYYLGKKFLSRSKKTEMIWTQPDKAKEMLDEEFYFLIELLPQTIDLDGWKAMNDIQRLRLVESALDTLEA